MSFLTRQRNATPPFSRFTTSWPLFTDAFIHWVSITLLTGWPPPKPHFKPRFGCDPMPEKHIWHGRNYLYYGPRDYAGALAELENARRSLPNDPRLSELTGYILRRRGQQEEGLRNLEKAIELDPRNYLHHATDRAQLSIPAPLSRGGGHSGSRADHYSEGRCHQSSTALVVDFYWKADTKPLHQAIDSILAGDPGAISQVADSWFVCALAEHDRVAAERALVALGDNPWLVDAAVILSRSFGEGLLARVMKDEAKARAAFSKARAEQEKIVQAQSDYGPALCVLGLIDAALGRKEAALEEARRAIELLPVEKDSINGSYVMLVYFAIIAGLDR